MLGILYVLDGTFVSGRFYDVYGLSRLPGLPLQIATKTPIARVCTVGSGYGVLWRCGLILQVPCATMVDVLRPPWLMP